MSSRPYRVLVVDDEPGILRIFMIALSNYGFVVDSVESTRQAADRLERGTYDIIVSDQHMPGGDGVDLLGLMRRRGIRTPMLVMTGRPSVEGKRHALAQGALDYMIKPVMPSELRRVIESALLREPGVPTQPPSTRPGPS